MPVPLDSGKLHWLSQKAELDEDFYKDFVSSRESGVRSQETEVRSQETGGPGSVTRIHAREPPGIGRRKSYSLTAGPGTASGALGRILATAQAMTL